MFYNQKLQCPVCQASVPFCKEGWATCLFCLHSFKVPKLVSKPIARNSALEQELARVQDQLQDMGRAIKFNWKVFLLYTVGYLGPFGGTFYMFIKERQAHNAPFNAFDFLPFILIGLFCLTTPVSFVISYFQKRGAALAHISRLPASNLELGDGLRATCPECGAPVEASSRSMTAKCRHCLTESLLPASMIAKVLLKKFQRVAELRQKRKKILRSAEETGNPISIGYYLLIILGVFAMCGIPVATLISMPEKTIDGITSAIFVGGLLIDLGLYGAIWSSKRKRVIWGTVYIAIGLTATLFLLLFFPVGKIIGAVVLIDILVVGFGALMLLGKVEHELEKNTCRSCGYHYGNADLNQCPKCRASL